MSKIYQHSVVALVDLLGFKQALNDEENAKEILALLHQMKSGENKNCSASIETISSITEIKITPSISAFSDHMVISVSEKIFDNTISWRHAVIEILNIIQQLANLVIQKGFLLRGGITLGNLYHENGIVFGPALNEAYELESKIAKYPRILVSPQLVDCFNADKNSGTQDCFLQDVDGNYYLDYLPAALSHPNKIKTYQRTIEEKILLLMEKTAKNHEHGKENLKILEKWFWFEKYHQTSTEKIAVDFIDSNGNTS